MIAYKVVRVDNSDQSKHRYFSLMLLNSDLDTEYRLGQAIRNNNMPFFLYKTLYDARDCVDRSYNSPYKVAILECEVEVPSVRYKIRLYSNFTKDRASKLWSGYIPSGCCRLEENVLLCTKVKPIRVIGYANYYG